MSHMPITSTQARTIQAIVNLFETSQVLGNYGQVTLLPGDTGHLTFGRSQTTLGLRRAARSRSTLLRNRAPASAGGSRVAAPHEGRDVRSIPTRTAQHPQATADDPVMRDTQDAFFDERYFMPAMRTAERRGIRRSAGMRRRLRLDSARVFSRVSAGRLEHRQPSASAPGCATTSPRAALAGREQPRRPARDQLPHGRVQQADRSRHVGARTAARRSRRRDLVGHPDGASLHVLRRTTAGCRPLAFLTSAPLCRGVDVRLVQVALAERGANVTLTACTAGHRQGLGRRPAARAGDAGHGRCRCRARRATRSRSARRRRLRAAWAAHEAADIERAGTFPLLLRRRDVTGLSPVAARRRRAPPLSPV